MHQEDLNIRLFYSYDITDISGANAQEKLLDEIIQENDVIVLTAQILVDALKSRRVAINDFSLLIFDECHHTDKGHPYNDIMLNYLEIKFPFRGGRNKAVKERLPQIIGLTASLGVGKARNKNEAQEHILQLCANLDCSVIVTVEKYKKDLKGMTGRCERICHEIPDGEADYFDEIVRNVMITIEGMMPQLPAGRNGRPQMNHGSQQYQQWLKELERSSVALKSRDQFTLVQHLMVYNTALSIKKSCRVKDALKYVTEFHDRQSENKFKDIDRKLRMLYEKAKQDLDSERRKKGELKNPKLEAVAQLLRTKYQACVEEGGQQTAKGMLFTQTRENTKALKAWLDENSDLAFIRAERLVGTGKGEDGMTQCQQEEVIASFRSGRINLLVSTTVGEEGIDIPDCKYVIRYDVRGNEIASVQSRGRVRDKEGQYEVVAGKETGVIEKENLNVIREEMMEEAIGEVKAMDGDQYNRKILDLQLRAVHQRQRKETSKKCEKDKRQHDKVKLFCRKCQVFACSGNDIRCIKEAHHVVIDKDFTSKFHFKKSKSPRVLNEIELTGPLHCLDCDAEWGVMLKYQSKEMPCIKASCFGFEFENEAGVKTTLSFKKWKDVRMNVESFEHCQTQVLDCFLDLAELCLD
ncbi:probable ATP-dependent RNA helicase DDX58 [Orbicella faveolata]|uniref:probable ATP-dependent RNA helicase DDX58 n=1 Tax=Orbicella faveolata TaxID=48498 RepID=UPI0009E3FFEF|nr:probable ATP-dependent RNA helicase DDX58 [Orbicella faveolata]